MSILVLVLPASFNSLAVFHWVSLTTRNAPFSAGGLEVRRKGLSPRLLHLWVEFHEEAASGQTIEEGAEGQSTASPWMGPQPHSHKIKCNPSWGGCSPEGLCETLKLSFPRRQRWLCLALLQRLTQANSTSIVLSLHMLSPFFYVVDSVNLWNPSTLHGSDMSKDSYSTSVSASVRWGIPTQAHT